MRAQAETSQIANVCDGHLRAWENSPQQHTDIFTDTQYMVICLRACVGDMFNYFVTLIVQSVALRAGRHVVESARHVSVRMQFAASINNKTASASSACWPEAILSLCMLSSSPCARGVLSQFCAPVCSNNITRVTAFACHTRASVSTSDRNCCDVVATRGL